MTKHYLTFKGAKKLDACPGALRSWKRIEGIDHVFEVSEILDRFERWCVACFVAEAMNGMTHEGFSPPHGACYCRTFRHAYDKAVAKRYVEDMLRNVIELAIKTYGKRT